jgi:hypothetical protein
VHPATHFALQSDLQLPSALNVPGSTVHSVLHELVQLSVQVVSTLAVHIPLHFDVQEASKLRGVHCASQPPWTTNLQVEVSVISTTVPSRLVQVNAASASDAESTGTTTQAATMKHFMIARFMGILFETRECLVLFVRYTHARGQFARARLSFNLE